MTRPDDRPDAGDVAERIGLVRRLIERRGADAALLGSRRNVAWLTIGADAHVVTSTDQAVAQVLVERHDARVLAPVNEAARLRDEEMGDLPLDVTVHAWHEAAPVPRGRILGDDELEADLVPLRVRLGPLERIRLAWLGDRLSDALDTVLADRARPGSSERALAASVLERLAADGIRAPVILAAADERIDRYRHPLPGETPVRGRIMLVAVAERWGLHAALTRIRELHAPDAEIAARRAAVERIHRSMLAATRPGVSTGDVLRAAQAAYAAEGFADEWRLHHQGGVLGYRPREVLAVPGEPTELAAGMAVAWNPSITGTKVEGSYLLTDDPGRPLLALTTPEDLPSPPDAA